MILTISGPPGSGKSTLSNLLAEKLGLKIISPGSLFREKAKEMGLGLAELGELAEKDPEIDREIDRAQQEIARKEDNLILEGRLSGHLIDADLKIWLTAPQLVRAQRIAQRENIPLEQALQETQKREASENKRYQSYYNLDLQDTTIYHLVLDTSKFTPEALAEIVQTALKHI